MFWAQEAGNLDVPCWRIEATANEIKYIWEDNQDANAFASNSRCSLLAASILKCIMTLSEETQLKRYHDQLCGIGELARGSAHQSIWSKRLQYLTKASGFDAEANPHLQRVAVLIRYVGTPPTRVRHVDHTCCSRTLEQWVMLADKHWGRRHQNSESVQYIR